MVEQIDPAGTTTMTNVAIRVSRIGVQQRNVRAQRRHGEYGFAADRISDDFQIRIDLGQGCTHPTPAGH